MKPTSPIARTDGSSSETASGSPASNPGSAAAEGAASDARTWKTGGRPASSTTDKAATGLPTGTPASASDPTRWTSGESRSARDETVARDERRGGAGAWPWLLLLLLVGAAGLAAWFVQGRFHDVERDGDRRVGELSSRTQDIESRYRGMQDNFTQLQGLVQGQVKDYQAQLQGQLKDLQQKDSALDARLGETGSKLGSISEEQSRIRAQYQEILKARQANAMAEAAQAINTASRFLQLQQNVDGAVAMLEDASATLNGADPTDANGLRRRVLQDIEKLKALPKIDIQAQAVALDGVLDSVGRMPMMAESERIEGEKVDLGIAPANPDSAARVTPAEGTNEGSQLITNEQVGVLERGWNNLKSWFGSAVKLGGQGVDAARQELKDVVTIRRVDNPEILLLGPQQRYAARDNLRLMLLNARINLLTGQQDLFRSDVKRAADSIRQVFDLQDDSVKAALASLDTLGKATITRSLPSLSDTLAAARTASRPASGAAASASAPAAAEAKPAGDALK